MVILLLFTFSMALLFIIVIAINITNIIINILFNQIKLAVKGFILDGSLTESDDTL